MAALKNSTVKESEDEPRIGLKTQPIIRRSVEAALQRVDDFINGDKVVLPSAIYRRAIEAFLDKPATKASARTACLFFLFYWLQDPLWNVDSLPVGIRGTNGDKLLSEELTKRSITFHNNITAYAENLGWKGNVRKVKLSEHRAFATLFGEIRDAPPDERQNMADLLACRFAESKRETTPLPPVGSDVLTFARSKKLFYELVNLQTEGHVPQFLVAALLTQFRKPQRIAVSTHHPHAADKSDGTAGDIEELQDNRLVRAYEVTARDDWKNRISNFKNKMDKFGLSKYTIIAKGVNKDDTWSVPAKVILALEEYGRDIVVIDLLDVLNFFAAELSPTELLASVNLTHHFLSDLKLCGRHEFKEKYVETVRHWLDSSTPEKAL